MIYRRLGRAGLQLSAFSFGSWVTFKNQIEESKARDLMAMAYERGVNFFDNAEIYANGESETIMGISLKKLGWSRDSYCVSSKAFWGGKLPTQVGLSRKHLRDACHAALKRLQVDYLDLYFCHRPDPETPIEETVRAMTDLIHQGKVLYWGTSEWSAQQITEAFGIARQFNLEPPSMEQPQYNLFHRDRVESEYAPLYEKFGLGTTIWSPLASGILTGKYKNGVPADSRMAVAGYEWLREEVESAEGRSKIEKTNQLIPIAADIGATVGQLSLAWCLLNENVSTVILGATRLEQLKENLLALETLEKLTPDVRARIEAIVKNKPEPTKSYK
jgi:voltage-dependent potassium channel beta subunit